MGKCTQDPGRSWRTICGIDKDRCHMPFGGDCYKKDPPSIKAKGKPKGTDRNNKANEARRTLLIDALKSKGSLFNEEEIVQFWSDNVRRRCGREGYGVFVEGKYSPVEYEYGYSEVRERALNWYYRTIGVAVHLGQIRVELF